MQVRDRLVRDEDAVLRRLHWFETHGTVLSPDLVVLKQTLRARDQRATIRPPFDDVEPLDLATLQRVAAIPHPRGGC